MKQKAVFGIVLVVLSFYFDIASANHPKKSQSENFFSLNEMELILIALEAEKNDPVESKKSVTLAGFAISQRLLNSGFSKRSLPSFEVPYMVIILDSKFYPEIGDSITYLALYVPGREKPIETELISNLDPTYLDKVEHRIQSWYFICQHLVRYVGSYDFIDGSEERGDKQ